MNNTEQQVIDLIAGVLRIDAEELSPQTEIGEPGEWDSLRNIEIVAALEEGYGIRLTAGMLMDLEDIADIARLVESVTQARP